jgi:hypothetical protein
MQAGLSPCSVDRLNGYNSCPDATSVPSAATITCRYEASMSPVDGHSLVTRHSSLVIRHSTFRSSAFLILHPARESFRSRPSPFARPP